MKILEVGLYILGWVFLILAFNYEAHHKKINTDYLYCDDDCMNCFKKGNCKQSQIKKKYYPMVLDIGKDKYFPLNSILYDNAGKPLEAEIWDGEDFIVLEDGEFEISEDGEYEKKS